jgi:E3 ubiquitin-protein ligase SHPRH
MIEKVEKKSSSRSFAIIHEFPSFEESGGIEVHKLLDQCDIFSGALNDQAGVMDEWRGRLIKLLTQRLVDQDEGLEIKGDEYDISADEQDEGQSYPPIKS